MVPHDYVDRVWCLVIVLDGPERNFDSRVWRDYVLATFIYHTLLLQNAVQQITPSRALVPRNYILMVSYIT